MCPILNSGVAGGGCMRSCQTHSQRATASPWIIGVPIQTEPSAVYSPTEEVESPAGVEDSADRSGAATSQGAAGSEGSPPAHQNPAGAAPPQVKRLKLEVPPCPPSPSPEIAPRTPQPEAAAELQPAREQPARKDQALVVPLPEPRTAEARPALVSQGRKDPVVAGLQPARVQLAKKD